MSVEGRKLAALIADHIERFPETYAQAEWGGVDEDGNQDDRVSAVLAGAACNTTACVAGWAVRLAGETEQFDPDEPVSRVAGRLLGLGPHEAGWLFGGCRTDETMPAVLRHYAATGEIDPSLDTFWDRSFPGMKSLTEMRESLNEARAQAMQVDQ